MADTAQTMSGETLGQAGLARPSHEKRRSVRKIEPLPGTLRAELIRCGKPSCRCARGEPHGPYLYRRWREGDRQRHQYVRPANAERVKAELAEWRRLHPPARSMRAALAALRRLLRPLGPAGV
jgi:hypothetical protein